MKKCLILLFILRGVIAFSQTPFTESNLPIVVLNTNGKGIPNDIKIDIDAKIIYNGVGKTNRLTDKTYAYNGKMGIELRGSSSLDLSPKKPYSIELRDSMGNNREEILFDMSKDEDWALIAPYADKTLIRDVLMYQLGREIMPYAPRTRFCELVLNGTYQGVYTLTERIKRGNRRVNIAKLDTLENAAGDALTGGYIIKVDKLTDNNPSVEAGWTSAFRNPNGGRTYFQYHYPKPESMKTAQKVFIRSAILDFEAALDGPNFKDTTIGYHAHIDVQSFIDYSILNEISKNVDGYRLSTYLYKDRNSVDKRFKMGPIWDFNLALGNANFCEAQSYFGWQYKQWQVCQSSIPFWWEKLFQDKNFLKAYKKRWQTLRKNLITEGYINALIDSMSSELRTAQGRNHQFWNYLNKAIWPVPQVAGSYDGEILYLKDWIKNRITWLDEQINGFHLSNNPIDLSELDVFPNPSVSDVNFAFYLKEEVAINLTIYNTLGQVIWQYNEKHRIGDNNIIWKQHSSTGLFLYEFRINGKIWKTGKIIH